MMSVVLDHKHICARAMRTYDQPAVDYWRPLIWHIDVALQHLPPHEGKLYRGINVRFSEAEYKPGERVVWPALSSASMERRVAHEFVSGDEGSLFFIQCRGGGALISQLSRFPDEAEVLFRPNTVFQITSTLYGSSDIGQFYSCIGNIAMTDLSGRQAQAHAPAQVPSAPIGSGGTVIPAPANGTARVVVDLPKGMVRGLLDGLEGLELFAVTNVDMVAGAKAGAGTHVTLDVAGRHGSFPMPDPVHVSDMEESGPMGSGHIFFGEAATLESLHVELPEKDLDSSKSSSPDASPLPTAQYPLPNNPYPSPKNQMALRVQTGIAPGDGSGQIGLDAAKVKVHYSIPSPEMGTPKNPLESQTRGYGRWQPMLLSAYTSSEDDLVQQP